MQGHTIDAAAFMGQVRVALRAMAALTSDPGDLLARTNDLLLTLGGDLFATCTVMRLDPATGLVESARAGTSPACGRPPTAGPGSRGRGRAAARRPGGHGVPRHPAPAHHRRRLHPAHRRRGGGPALTVDEGLDQVVRLAGIAAVAGMAADSLAAAVIRNAERVGHEDDAAVLVVAHDDRAGALRG
ncbi:PPM-type phosphatase domain-containing protein OS=Streptomyces fumanus OX=67302 GN=GCM10018772_18080 PE=4 SV=1 [Streptomyces fumanus]